MRRRLEMHAAANGGQQPMDPTPTTFILVSFEGPDRYSLAGGLGVRVTELSRALASAGHQTHVS
jgi:hypothetical protein